MLAEAVAEAATAEAAAEAAIGRLLKVALERTYVSTREKKTVQFYEKGSYLLRRH